MVGWKEAKRKRAAQVQRGTFPTTKPDLLLYRDLNTQHHHQNNLTVITNSPPRSHSFISVHTPSATFVTGPETPFNMSQIRRAPSPAMDPLDLPDYNPVGHLNMLFPTSSTLSSLPQVSAGLKHHTATLTQQINDKVRAQEESNNANLAGIERAKQDLTDLFHRIEGVAERARVTEEGITKMTGEIKRLDSGKRNLTVSMTVLKRLQMLSNYTPHSPLQHPPGPHNADSTRQQRPTNNSAPSERQDNTKNARNFSKPSCNSWRTSNHTAQLTKLRRFHEEWRIYRGSYWSRCVRTLNSYLQRERLQIRGRR